MWISPETLYSPVLASFADSKLFDFARASNSMTLRTKRMLYVTHYVRYITLGACALGTVAKIVNPGHSCRSWNDSGFFSTLRVYVCLPANCYGMCSHVVPFDSLACMHACMALQCLDPSGLR